MLRGEPADWAQYLPGYGAYRVLIDGSLTAGFNEDLALLVAVGWVVALLVAAVALTRRTIRPSAH